MGNHDPNWHHNMACSHILYKLGFFQLSRLIFLSLWVWLHTECHTKYKILSKSKDWVRNVTSLHFLFGWSFITAHILLISLYNKQYWSPWTPNHTFKYNGSNSQTWLNPILTGLLRASFYWGGGGQFDPPSDRGRSPRNFAWMSRHM